MGDFDQEALNEELIECAIQESIQDTYKLSCSVITNVSLCTSCVGLGCVSTGDVYALQELSGCVSAFRESDRRGRQPLHAAAIQPQKGILHVVLQDSAFQTEDGDTALTLAAEAGMVENVKMLLKHGASPHNTNSSNESPLLIAVRQGSYDMVLALIMSGAFVEQVCLTKWTAIHEAAKVGCPAILMLLLRHGAKVSAQDGHGVTPLGIAAEYGNTEVLDILIQHGGDVNTQACNGDTVLYDATGSGNLDCIKLLLKYGANPNVASYACQLPIHRAAYEGHILALRTLIPITTKKAIYLSGQSPVHSAADGGQVECLDLLIQTGYDVNALLHTHISENYSDLRKTALYFAVSSGDVTCAEMLLAAGARTDLDPLQCILIAIRSERYELVQLLLSYGADVNCYFRVISNTVFPTALQYCLRDHVMLRLLLNSGYQVHKVNKFDSHKTEELVICLQPCPLQVFPFCDFVSVSWLTHLVGSVVRILLDYVSHVNICRNLKRILKRRPEWDEISDILSNTPRSLRHLCRLVIRGLMSLRVLNNPAAMAAVPFPPRLKKYLTYREYDLYSNLSST
uniref:SOCS box domain-containing protein n=1 Tax=Monopterus albus TaxID=43700 RepID=A0A3Q3K4V7_MONAL